MATYATWNPADKEVSLVLSNGNLTVTQPASVGWRSVRSTTSVSSGKYYWEVEIDDAQGGDTMVGVGTSSFSLSSYAGSDANSYGWYGSGTKYTGAASYPYTPTYTTNDVVGVALDLDNGKIWFSKNGSWTGDPVAGTGEAFSGLSGEFYAAVSLYNANKILTANFGTSSFSYTVPDGFSAGLYSGVLATFTFSSPSPIHLSTVYGDSQTLQLTVTISGEEPSYIYDAIFYDATTSGIIGPTVSGTISGQPVSTSFDTVDGGDYSWYLTASISGVEDTSSTYEFTNCFLCAGTVKEGETALSGIPVRLYRRDTGELVGYTTSAGISGTFEIDTIYNEYHYAVAIYANTVSGIDITETNALIYDWITP